MVKRKPRKLTTDPSVVFNFQLNSDGKEINFSKNNINSETAGLDSDVLKISSLSNLSETIDRYYKTIVSDVQELNVLMVNETNLELGQKFYSFQKEIKFKFNILIDLMGNIQSEWNALEKGNDELNRLNKLLFEKVRTLTSSKQPMHNDIAIQCNIHGPKLDQPGKVIKVNDKKFHSYSKDLASKNLDNAVTQTHTGSSTHNYKFSKTKKVDSISVPDYIVKFCEHKTPDRDFSDCTKIILLGVDDSISVPDIMIAINEKVGDTIPSIHFGRKYKLRQGLKYNWTISITSWIANSLIQHGKLNINSLNYTVMPFINIKRCFHCQHLGHLANNCINDLACANCGQSHDSANCENISRCINCITHNRTYKKSFDINHPAFSPYCSTFKFYFKQKQSLYNIT